VTLKLAVGRSRLPVPYGANLFVNCHLCYENVLLQLLSILPVLCDTIVFPIDVTDLFSIWLHISNLVAFVVHLAATFDGC